MAGALALPQACAGTARVRHRAAFPPWPRLPLPARSAHARGAAPACAGASGLASTSFDGPDDNVDLQLLDRQIASLGRLCDVLVPLPLAEQVRVRGGAPPSPTHCSQ